MAKLGDASAANQGSGRSPRPVSRSRRRTATLTIALVMALLGGLVFVAVNAEGREISQASSNDGGAWLVNRELAVVGHRNRAAGELSSFMRVSDSPTADVHQAEGVVVVHDAASNQLFEVDTRSFREDLEPTQLPEFTTVTAVNDGVVVVRAEPLTVWMLATAVLPTLSSLDGVDPDFTADGSGWVAASEDGRIAVVEDDPRQLSWISPTGVVSAPIALDDAEPLLGVTIRDASAVVLDEQGDTQVIGPLGIEHDIDWVQWAPGVAPMSVLQQPSLTQDGRAPRPAKVFAGITGQGELLEVRFGDNGVQVTRQGSLNGTQPLAPIAHEDCLYAVVIEPPLFGASCEQFAFRRLEGASQELRIRLVNGWVWVNDLEDGGTWVTNDQLMVEEISDWGLASQALNQPDPADEEDGSSDESGVRDEIVVEDPDAEGQVQDSDDFNAADVNAPPVPVDDTARTRTDRSVVVPVLANDTDVNNDILVVSSVELVSGEAQVSVTPSLEEVQVTPAAGFAGTVQLNYWVSDGRSDPVIATVTVEVISSIETNTPPIARTDVVATAPGHATTIDVLLNDIDPEGDALALVGIESETGTLRWDPIGQITFTPDTTTAAGWLELPYIVADDLGEQSEGLLRVEIRDRGANQEPDARNDQATTVVGRPVVVNLLANDSDPDGDPLIVGSRPVLLEPEDAVVRTSTTTDGEFVFEADDPGTYLFSYTVTDSAEGGSESDTARIRVDVELAITNSPPIAVRDDIVIPTGETRTVYALANDGDPDGDVVAIVDWQSVPGLLVTEFNDASGHVGFRIAVAPGTLEQTSFTYSISDGVNAPVSAPIVVAVVDQTPRDQPPFAVDDIVEARAGSTIEDLAVLSNDFDPEGGSLRIVAVGESDDAAVSISTDEQTLIVAIPSNALSSFSVPYDIEDLSGNRAAATVRVQLISADAPNRPPAARTDRARTVAGAPIAIEILRNDSDPDADAIALEGVSEQPAHGSAVATAEGTIVYTPDPAFSGTDVFRYAIVDSKGDRSVGDVFVGVMEPIAANLPPIANDDSYVLAGVAVATPLDVLANDFDPEGDPMRVIDVTTASTGTVSIDSFGRVEFMPPPNLSQATTAVFDYTIADNAGNQARATVSVDMEAFDAAPTPPPVVVVAEPTPEVTPTPEVAVVVEPTPTPEIPGQDNLAPVAVNDDRGPANEGDELRIDVLANDFDPDGPKSELRVVEIGAGTGAYLQDDKVVIILGSETTVIPYTIEDEFGAQSSALVTVVVIANKAPIVEPLSTSTAFETSIDLDLGAQVSDPDGDTVFFVCCENIRGGTLSNVVSDAGRLLVTFTPSAEFVGQAAFSYVADDQVGHQTSGSVTIDVSPPDNQAPETTPNTVQVPQGAVVTVDLTEISRDDDSDVVTRTLISEPALDGVSVSLSEATAVVSVDRSVAIGDSTSFVYEISDGVLSAQGTVEIVIIEGANREPVVRDAEVELAANASTSVDLSALTVDNDPGDSVGWTIDASQAGVLQVELVGSTLQVAAPADATGQQGQVTYTATDTRGASASAVVKISVLDPTAPLPSAVDDEATTLRDGSVDIDVLANDVDPLGQGLKIVSVSASWGTATIAGPLINFAPGDEVGAALIQYTISDAANRESSATITVETLGVPDKPAPPSVLADSEQVTISWDTPQSNGADLTGYTITTTGATKTGSLERQVGLQNSLVWDDLINGEVYTFTVVAVNSVGPSEASLPSLPVIPDQVPETPAPPKVGFLDRALGVSWLEPENAGTDIIGYELEIGGSLSGTIGVTGTEYIWQELNNGDSYAFRVRAENDAGFSPWSALSQPENPETVPEKPVIGKVERGNLSGTLVVEWSKPADNGGEIIEYEISSTAGTALVSGADTLTYDWANLPTGQEFNFQVRARNRSGWGPLSLPSNSVVACGAPDAPSLEVERGDQLVSITVTVGPDNGCGITDYTFTTTDVLSGTNTVINEQNPNIDLSGLTNGRPYTFTVRATNEVGPSAPSAASPQVIPAGRPICPSTGLTVQASGVGQISIDWDDAIDNGSPITEYELDTGTGFQPVSAGTTAATSANFGGLSNGTQYSYAIRAVNDVGTSPTCGSGSATTWDIPTPLTGTFVWDSDLATLSWSLGGGDSVGTPVTTWTTFLGGSGTLCQYGGTGPGSGIGCISDGEIATPVTTNGTGPLPASQVNDISVSGEYFLEVTVCNAVGCRDNRGDISFSGYYGFATGLLTARPTQMTVDDIYLTTVFGTDPPSPGFLGGGIPPTGVNVQANLRDPILDFGNITSFVWETRQIDPDFIGFVLLSGTASGNTDTVVGSWPGYSTHPGGNNNGQDLLWEVRAAAVNNAGQGPWSDWASIRPVAPAPQATLTSSGIGCTLGSGTAPGQECLIGEYAVYGLYRNTTYPVVIETTGGGVNCDQNLVTSGSSGEAFGTVQCTGAIGFQFRVSVDGLTSNYFG